LAPHPLAGEHRQRLGDVAATMAEALFAEGIGHAAGGDLPQPFLDRLAVAFHAAQHQHEAVARQRTARQLAVVARLGAHAQALALQGLQRRRLAPGQLHAETLDRHRMAVLEARVADRDLRDAGPARNFAGDEAGVHAALLDGQQQVLAVAAGLEAVQLLDPEVLRAAADARRHHRRAESLHAAAHARTSRATAWAAIPSPRPVKPSFSLVVALTLTASRSTSQVSAMRWRISAACGPTLGRSQTMVMSALPSFQPHSPTRPTQWRSRPRLAAPRQRSSLGGKCTPMSPSASAPSSASHRACRATSPSLCATTPRSCGTRTPPSMMWSP